MDSIIYIGITQSFFAALIIFTKETKQLSDKFMALWLLIIAGELISALIKEKIGIIPHIPIIPFLFGPIMFFYVTTMIGEKNKMLRTDWLHFIPFILFLAVSIIFFRNPDFNTPNILQNDSFLSLRVFIGVSFVCSIVIYTIIVFMFLHRYKLNIKNIFSFTSEKITLNWVKILAVCFCILPIFTIFHGIGHVVIGEPVVYENYGVLKHQYIGFTAFAFLYSYFGIKQPALFGNRGKLKQSNENNEPKSNNICKYERSGLKEKDAQSYLKQLIDYVEIKKPYLNGTLAIQDIANELSISRHYLTQIINKKLEKNFYTFINEYRVAEFKLRLSDKTNKHIILIGIAYDSGFNSKSSFNISF
ncbi:MAG: helix-turn-helix domain-containing protein [Bacteroidales bacterium]|nr:helix-turn-helix domain-containing protein [Bacteroidales bacterium]